MSKRVLDTLVFFTIFAVIALSTSCFPQEQIRSEAFASLEQMNKTSIGALDKEIAMIDQQVREADDKVVKLEQVVASALKWVESKKGSVDISTIPCG